MDESLALNTGSWAISDVEYEAKLVSIGLLPTGAEVSGGDPVFVPTNFVDQGPDMFEWWRKEMARAQAEWNARMGQPDDDDFEEDGGEEFYSSAELQEMLVEAQEREVKEGLEREKVLRAARAKELKELLAEDSSGEAGTGAVEQAAPPSQPPKPEGAGVAGGVDKARREPATSS